MKNFKFIKSGFCEKLKLLLIPIGLLIGSMTTQTWAGDLCDFLHKESDDVYIKYSKNGASATQQNIASSKQSDITLGTVTSLSITEFRGITKKHDGNVCAVRLYYKIATTGDIEIGDDNYVSAGYNNNGYDDWTWDDWWACQQFKNSSVGLNILDGLAPGSYWFNFYFSINGNSNSSSGCWDHQKYWSNDSKNYHMSFTVPSKNLTVAGSDAYGNTVSGSQTGISSGTAYTIRATAKPGYKFNGWTKTSGGSSITIADASSAETTVTFNDYANDATVTASFVRTYAYIEGRFKIKNEARDAETTTYGSGNWNNEATTIQMTYESANERYSLHTHMTPYELSQNMGTDVQLTPYFYIKSSTSSSSLTNVWAYRPNSGESFQKLTTAGYGNKKAVAPSAVENSLWFASADESGYAVLYFDDSHVWYELEQTLTYNGNGNTGGSAPSRTYVERTKSVTAATKPGALAKSGYDFGGWNEANDGSGTNYTAGSSSITMGSTNKTVYAKWTQTVKLHDNNGDAHSGSVTATYNASSVGSITAPTRDGYSVEGYYAEAECTNKVMEANGTLVNYTGYVVGGKWQHNAATTLYAKWTENLHDVDVTVAVGNHGSVSTAKVTNIGVATASGTITATADEGYHFTGWTIPSSGVTLASGTTSSESITINATADSKTITANFAANTFTVHFNDNYPSGTTGSGSMSNESFTYNTTKSLTANDFTCEGYTFDGWKIDNAGDVIAGGTDGCTLTTGNGVTVQLYAQWADNNKYYFKGGKSGSETDWSVAENWTKGAAPSSADHEVYILAPVKISSGTVHVKSVDIITTGSYSPSVGSSVTAASSKLTIGAGAMLIVEENVQNYDRSTSKADSTRASTLHIESGATGNGALVWGEEDSTPGYAQVDFYTKSHGEKDQNSSINQYIGTPFSNEQSILYQYYYSWLFKIKRTDGVLDWDLMSGNESMNEFEGYNLITAYDKGTVYQMEGILVSNKDVTLNSTSSTPRLVYSGSGGASNPNNENVLANSWVAPIKINNMSGAFGDHIEASIHIFNAGSPNDAGGGGTAGNYTAYTVGEAEDDDVIPSMQSFSVYTKGASPVLTLDYSALVYDDADDDLIKPNFAPRRSASIRETQDALKIRIEGENGWADELKIFIHDEFSNAFENGWDAHKMYGYPEAPQLYAVTTDGNMAINCVPTADNNVLGFTPGSEDNEYTFSFTYDGDEEYYLKDTKLNIETLINTEATYTFTSEAEDSEMRFIIIKRAPAVATDAETVSGDRLAVSGVQKIMHNGQLYIIRDGGIYDATGTMVK